MSSQRANSSNPDYSLHEGPEKEDRGERRHQRDDNQDSNREKTQKYQLHDHNIEKYPGREDMFLTGISTVFPP